MMLVSGVHEEAFSCGLAGRIKYKPTCMRLASRIPVTSDYVHCVNLLGGE